MHARLEVAIARKHGRDDQIKLGDGFFDVRVERATVADAVMHGDAARQKRMVIGHR